jgi:uncharacterized protein YbcI
MDAHREGNRPSGMISTSVVQTWQEWTGRGPTRAKTFIDDDMVTVLFGDTLTRGERRLVESGHADSVLRLRDEYQQVMRDELVAIVERHLDRKVIAFMSQNHIDPDLAVEVFVLEPAERPSGAQGARELS